jgi:protoporphyrinogen oxidase
MESEHGSILRAIFSSKRRQQRSEPLATVSFKSGMSRLVNALADNIGRENIILNGNPVDYKAKVTVLATKASEAAELLSDADSLHLNRDWSLDLSWLVRQVNYAPIFLLTVSLPRKLLRKPLSGFGFLSHVNSGLATLGTIWASELFTERNLSEEYLFTSYLSPSLEIDLEALRSQAIAEQIQVLQQHAVSQLSAANFTVVDTKYIEEAIPQYELGAPELLESVECKLKSQNDLLIVGNYLHGISLEDVVKQSHRVARLVETALQSKTPVLQ